MIRLEMKNYNMTITKKQQKYQHYLLEIDICKYLTGEKTLHFNWRQIIQQAKFAFCLLGEAFEKQKKQPGVIESLDLSFLTPKPATEATPT